MQIYFYTNFNFVETFQNINRSEQHVAKFAILTLKSIFANLDEGKMKSLATSPNLYQLSGLGIRNTNATPDFFK